MLVTGLAATTAAGLLAVLVGGTVPLALGAAARRCRRGQHQLGQRPGGRRLVPGRSAAGWPWASARWRSPRASGSRRSASPCSPTGTASRAALWVPVVACAVVRRGRGRGRRRPAPAGAHRRPAAANPYRRDRFLARVHAVSVLLVVPQFLVWTFALVWLVQDRGWSPAAAGSLVAVAQVAGALGRIAAGHLSDVVGEPDAPAALGGAGRRRDDGGPGPRGRAGPAARRRA